MALSGPNPLGGPADMIVVAEEPGVGLGAALSGLDEWIPGRALARRRRWPPPRSAIIDFPLWPVDLKDRAVFAGEVKGLWLWLVLWPDTAGALLVDPLGLRDLRYPGQDLDLPFGAVSPRLPAP